ncbi:MAG: hypothetical protein IJT91_07200 [Clostridia bacterium]|nr:hypothetical protein [Clostridia bacterium]
MKRKLLSIFLALAMVVSVFTLVSFADDSDVTAEYNDEWEKYYVQSIGLAVKDASGNTISGTNDTYSIAASVQSFTVTATIAPSTAVVQTVQQWTVTGDAATYTTNGNVLTFTKVSSGTVTVTASADGITKTITLDLAAGGGDEPPQPQGIQMVKVSGYDVKITGLEAANSYVIRYATGTYASVSALKNGTNAGFIQVSSASEAIVSLPTDGVHTIMVTKGSAVEFSGNVSIDVEDMEKTVVASANDMNVKVENLFGASQVRVMQNGAILMKINPTSFTTDGLKTWAEFTAPSTGTYTIRIVFPGNVNVDGTITITVPEAGITGNGRIFTLDNYGGAGNVLYIRFAKGVITTTADMKAAPDLRTFGAKYFKNDSAAFAALDAVNSETTTYTVQIGYASGYTEFVTFDITPTVPGVIGGTATITLTNVQSEDYYMDWVRCAPGLHNTLYAIRHAAGSQVKKTNDISDGKIMFTNLAAGEYTLYYLYDGWNLSEGMVTVTVH